MIGRPRVWFAHPVVTPILQLIEVPVVRSTPRNLTSPASPDAADQPMISTVGSPVIRKRLERLAAERSDLVSNLTFPT